jgi:hypothetical protein
MKAKFNVNRSWLQKAMICWAFFGFLAAKCYAGLGLPPVIAVQPLGLSVQYGGTAIITTTAVSLTSMQFKWLFNGQEIQNPKVVNVVIPLVGTVSTLTIPNVSSASQGAYSVKIENGVGEVTSHDATLIVLLAPVDAVLGILTGGTGMTNGGFQLNLSKPVNSNCVVDASIDLKNWTPVCTNSTATTNFSYLDTAATNHLFRYYRARLQ